MDSQSNVRLAETKALLARAHLAVRRMSSKLAHRRAVSEMDDADRRYRELRCANMAHDTYTDTRNAQSVDPVST